MWSKTPYPHECFYGEMRYDPDLNFWGCGVCGRKYQPPQVKVPQVPMWKPWEYDVPHLCLPIGVFWRPEKDYRC